jgi:predicted transcriptional regulator
MTTLTIEIPDELAARIARLPLETRNNFAVAAIEAALFQEDDYTDEDDAAIAAGIEDVKAGRIRPAEEFFQEFAARHGFTLPDRTKG